MAKHVGGRKISKKHTTVIPGVEKLVRTAEQIPGARVALGKIIPRGYSGPYRLQIQQISGGLRVEVRTPAGIQEVFIYTSDFQRVLSTLTKLPDP